MSMAYANLLNNPCGSPLTHPTYIGGDGGILTRFETDILVFVGATDTAGMVCWTPGGIGYNAGNASHLLAINAASSSASVAAGALPSSNAPGGSFLLSNASSARCVAACAQVYWPGSESARQGIVYTGSVNGGSVVLGSSYSTDGLANLTQYVDRMPNDFIETKWRPADGDQLSINPTTATPTIEQSRRNSILICVKGIPGSVGVRVRLVAIYEWQPAAADGITPSVSARNWTTSALNDVLSYLDNTMPDWQHKLGDVARMGASALVAAVSYQTARRVPRIEL